ncbi:MAG: SH3 domain-containing protein [Acidobacteriaceae bacterium]
MPTNSSSSGDVDSPSPDGMVFVWYRSPAALLLLAIVLLLPAGCSRFHAGASAEYVYVAVKKIYLRDRVAVVATRVAQVTNGERLRVLEHGCRFVKVQTPDGKEGWLEEHAVIDQAEFDKFQQLAKEYATLTPVATAVMYSEMYVHLMPGRKTKHFYLLPPNTKVFLLQRASVPRVNPQSVLGLAHPGAEPHGVAPTKPALSVASAGTPHTGRIHRQNFEEQFLPPVPMEDWWLVRDSKGQTGWMLSRDLQVDVPEEVAQYAENEKMVGAYVLRMVEDPDSGKPNGLVPEYVTVSTPYKDGLPYDFDQVRVFTWDTRRHRYGTAFRLRDVVGFFPVKVTPGDPNAPNGSAPTFSFQTAADHAVSLDPATGVPQAAQLQTVTYRMEGNLVRRVLPPGAKTASSVSGATRHARKRRRHKAH